MLIRSSNKWLWVTPASPVKLSVGQRRTVWSGLMKMWKLKLILWPSASCKRGLWAAACLCLSLLLVLDLRDGAGGAGGWLWVSKSISACLCLKPMQSFCWFVRMLVVVHHREKPGVIPSCTGHKSKKHSSLKAQQLQSHEQNCMFCILRNTQWEQNPAWKFFSIFVFEGHLCKTELLQSAIIFMRRYCFWIDVLILIYRYPKYLSYQFIEVNGS